MKKGSAAKNNNNKHEETTQSGAVVNTNKEELFLKMLKAKKVNQADLINLLKTSNLDLNKLDSHGYNLLHYCIKQEQHEIINTILNLDDNFQTLKADANIACCDSSNAVFLSPLLLAIVNCNDTQNSSKIIKYLIRAGADLNAKDEDESTLLLKACEKGRIDVLEYLESKKSSSEDNSLNWNESSKSGGPLHMAIIGDQEDVVNYLLEKKIDFAIKDQNQNTALHLALQHKNFNVFKLILDFIKNFGFLSSEEKKAIFSAVNDEDNTILHELSYAQSSILTDYIVKNNEVFGVDSEKKNKQNYTYVEVQKNIVQIKKDQELMDKKKREAIRLEKERIAQEIKQENENRKKMEEQMILEEEKQQEFRLKVLGYRNYIFVAVFVLFMVVLYFLLDSKIRNKKSAKIIL